MTEHEGERTPDPPRLLEWYRAGHSLTVGRVVASAVLLVGGCGLLGLGPLNGGMWIAILGATTSLFGGAMAVLGLQRALDRETFLGLRTDGLFIREPAGTMLLRWDDLERVDYERTSNMLALHGADGSTLRLPHLFDNVDGSELAIRIDRCRYRAQTNLLHR